MTGFAFALAIIALILPILRAPNGGAVVAPATPTSTNQALADLEVANLRVKSLEVVDDSGNVIVSMFDGVGGGSVVVNSASPNDHNVMITANQHGSNVQVTSLRHPKQFGQLKIMDRKPYLQMYEVDKPGDAKNFYQVPLYSASGELFDVFSETQVP